MRRKLIRFLLIASIVIAVLMVLGGIVNHETPAGFWIGAVWIVAVMFFNVWVGARRPRKRCPQCAEAVLSAANVCRHCGHQF